MERSSCNTTQQPLNQTCGVFPVAQALDRAAGGTPPCHELCLAPLSEGERGSRCSPAGPDTAQGLGGPYLKGHRGRRIRRSWRDVPALPCRCSLLAGRRRQCCEHLPSAPRHGSITWDGHFSCQTAHPSMLLLAPSTSENPIPSSTVTHCSLTRTSNKTRTQNFVGFKENESRVQPSQRLRLVLGGCSPAARSQANSSAAKQRQNLMKWINKTQAASTSSALITTNERLSLKKKIPDSNVVFPTNSSLVAQLWGLSKKRGRGLCRAWRDLPGCRCPPCSWAMVRAWAGNVVGTTSILQLGFNPELPFTKPDLAGTAPSSAPGSPQALDRVDPELFSLLTHPSHRTQELFATAAIALPTPSPCVISKIQSQSSQAHGLAANSSEHQTFHRCQVTVGQPSPRAPQPGEILQFCFICPLKAPPPLPGLLGAGRGTEHRRGRASSPVSQFCQCPSRLCPRFYCSAPLPCRLPSLGTPSSPLARSIRAALLHGTDTCLARLLLPPTPHVSLSFPSSRGGAVHKAAEAGCWGRGSSAPPARCSLAKYFPVWEGPRSSGVGCKAASRFPQSIAPLPIPQERGKAQAL